MNSPQGQPRTKFRDIYSKLLRGYSPPDISPKESLPQFYSSLLALNVDRQFLEGELNRLSKDQCLGPLKPVLNALFLECLNFGRDLQHHQDIKYTHALETLCSLTRPLLAKNFTGWELMEVFAGGTKGSDTVFMTLTSLVDETLREDSLPASIRHQTLQLALIFMCGVGQLSPGAYFLRKDLFPSIVSFIKSPDTEQFTFEAALLLAILANFHKSDAARLNPYLKRIGETEDRELMRKICWASNFALDAAVKAYQEIHSDDVSSTFVSTLGSVFASWRLDRALASMPVDPPKELFKNQPIEACVVLLPIYEFVRANDTFNSVLLEYISSDAASQQSTAPSSSPFTILSLSSYLLTHATSTSSPRSLAYANLSLSCLLAFSETEVVLEAFVQPNARSIRLCRQRLPLLPVPSPRRAPLCALLDCCVLWLRHNLHKRLEVYSYINCIWICYRVIWYLSKTHLMMVKDYEWTELWNALLGLLGFLASKVDSLYTTGGVESLVQESILLLDLCLLESSIFLPTPQALHEFTYELVRNAATLEKQASLLSRLAMPQAPKQKTWTEDPANLLTNILDTTRFYEGKISEAGARSANQAIRVVSREIDRDGLHVTKGRHEVVPPRRSDDVLGFSRYACGDGLALM